MTAHTDREREEKSQRDNSFLPFFTIRKGTTKHKQRNVDVGKSIHAHFKKQIGQELKIGKITVQ